MNRRGFLQAFLAACASPLVPTSAAGAVLPVSGQIKGLLGIIDEIPWTGMGGIDRAGNAWWRSTGNPGITAAELERVMEKLWQECTR